MSDYVCEQCREGVSEKAVTCPHCGYSPADEYKKYANRQMLFAALCFFSVIGSPVGLYLVYKARKQTKAGETAKPAVPA